MNFYSFRLCVCVYFDRRQFSTFAPIDRVPPAPYKQQSGKHSIQAMRSSTHQTSNDMTTERGTTSESIKEEIRRRPLPGNRF